MPPKGEKKRQNAQAEKKAAEVRSDADPAEIPVSKQGRLVITSMLFENFKSYYGKQKIGIFDKVSAIVCACRWRLLISPVRCVLCRISPPSWAQTAAANQT